MRGRKRHRKKFAARAGVVFDEGYVRVGNDGTPITRTWVERGMLHVEKPRGLWVFRSGRRGVPLVLAHHNPDWIAA